MIDREERISVWWEQISVRYEAGAFFSRDAFTPLGFYKVLVKLLNQNLFICLYFGTENLDFLREVVSKASYFE